jgi:protein-S-isoprenylcysteine O-methyltransferase Ste14
MTNQQSWWARAVGGFRIVTSRGVVVLMAVLLLFSASQWPRNGWLFTVMTFASVILIAIGVLGRLWCTLFISGYKTKHLITAGPYSIVRNPLYFFSFIGAVGVALATGMLTFVLLVLLLFAFYYPTVIQLEEEKLRQIHGATFDEYCRRVPSILPKFSLYQEPEFYEITPRLFRKAARDSIWFFVAFSFIKLIAHLHALQWKWLPVHFPLY